MTFILQKNKKKLCLLIITLFVFVISLFILKKIDNKKEIISNRNIKATHYFGKNSWPKNFWNAINKNEIENDFKKIKDNGFNSIILVIPWGEFQTKTNPVVYDESKFSDLDKIFKIAEKQNLKIILRVSYYWDLDPDDDMSPSQRFSKINTNIDLYKAWIDYIKHIYEVCKNNPNFSFAFLSWEDLYLPIINQSNLDQKNKLEFSKKSGYQNYLSNNFLLEELNKKYNTNYKDFSDVSIPERKSEMFRTYLNFADNTLINKFLIPAQKVFPNLSLEVRIDKDPIYNNKEEIIEWYNHSNTYNINSDYIVTYFSPAIGAKNESDETTADETMNRLKYFVNEIDKQTNKNIVIDQFNFFDNTPEYSYNTKIKDNEIVSFLNKALSFFRKNNIGYGLWTYDDYQSNSLFNPSFFENNSGWRNNDLVKYENKAIIFSDGEISQQTSTKEKTICVTAKCDQNNVLKINNIDINFSNEISTICKDIEPTNIISIKNKGAKKCEVYNTSLFTHVQKGLLFDEFDNLNENLQTIKLENKIQ